MIDFAQNDLVDIFITDDGWIHLKRPGENLDAEILLWPPSKAKRILACYELERLHGEA